MNMMVPNKVTASHLKRNAYLYIRQSTLRQVFENTESTKRQYALKDKAVALGWPIEQIEVIDSDLGQSGASAMNRTGFQQLVADVGMGRAGPGRYRTGRSPGWLEVPRTGTACWRSALLPTP